jgi:hypothetical protein
MTKPAAIPVSWRPSWGPKPGVAAGTPRPGSSMTKRSILNIVALLALFACLVAYAWPDIIAWIGGH